MPFALADLNDPDLIRSIIPKFTRAGRLAWIFVLLFAVTAGRNQAATWTKLTNLAPSGSGVMLQLTDGSVIALQDSDDKTWMKLTPDINGSYVNGTWTALAPMSVPRLYFASELLPSGKLWVLGGEYTGPGLHSNWSNTGEIYDPVTNAWSPIAPYPNQSGCPQLNSVTGNTSAGSSVITAIYPYATGLQVGWIITGSGIPSGTTVLSIDSATQIHISANATSTVTTDSLTFNHNFQLTGCFGDDPTMLLPGGMILAGDLVSSNTYLYNIAADSWSPTGSKVYSDSSDEEGWVKLTDGTVVTYDLFKSIAAGGSYAERYDPASGTWTSISPSDGSANGTIPQLSSSALGYELGPLLRLQDGRVLVIGANQHTALFTPSTNTWSAGSDILGTLSGNASPFGADDAPAAVLPNGHVLLAADAGPSQFTSSGNITSGSNIITNIPSTAILQVNWAVSGTGIPSNSRITSVDSSTQIHINNNATTTAVGVAIKFGGTFSLPTQLFDFNPGTGAITAASPAIPDTILASAPAYIMRMLVLPTGQVLFSDSTSQMWIYTPDGPVNPAVRPVINKVNYNGGGSFTLTGKQLNGQSAGSSYGDDVESDTNYPIIRMTNSAGNVFYARTANWSTVGVGGGSTPQTVDFTLHPSVTPGNYSVVVSGAGISSFPLFINITQAEINKQ